MAAAEVAVYLPCPPDCMFAYYPHRHLTTMGRLDYEAKICGCGQIGCCEVKRDDVAA